jgi:hypothetical protein
MASPMTGLTFEPLLPARYVLLIAVLAAPALAWCGWRSSAAAPRGRRLWLAALRVVASLAAIALLLNPGRMVHDESQAGRPVVAVLLDASASMAVPDAGGETRLAAARRSARKLAGRLPEDCDLRFLAFDAQARAIEAADLERLEPVGTGTDLAAAVEGALDRYGRSLEAAVIFSDGIQVAAADPLAAARRARAAQVALLPAALGGRVEPPDVAVTAPGGRRTAFLGQQLRIDAEVSARNIPPLALGVELLQDGQALERKELSLTAGSVRRVSFEVAARTPGFQIYQIRVASFPGEVDRANNSCTVGAVVIDAKMRVLLLEGNPSWDSKFLVQALRADPHVELRSIFRLAQGRFFCVESASGKYYSGGENTAFPATRAALEAYDLVILGRNVEYFISPEQAALLRAFVAERGGGLILARGKPYAGELAELAELEPVAWAQPTSGEARLVPTERGNALPFFQPVSGGDFAALSPQLPAIMGGQGVERVKPFCDVLARAQRVAGAAPAARPVGDKAAGEEAPPAIVVRRFGMGTVCLVNAEGLWKWAFLPPAKKELAEFYPHFWGQLLRWVAGNGDFLPGQDFLFRSSAAVVAPGQPFRLTIAARQDQLENYRPRILIKRGAADVQELAPGASAGEAAAWSAACALDAPGEYRAVLVNNTGRPATMEIPLTVTARRGESDELSADPALLARMAAASDGQAGGAEAAAEFLTRRLAERSARTEGQHRFQPLWDRAAVLLLIALAMGAEWALRRRGGLL